MGTELTQGVLDFGFEEPAPKVKAPPPALAITPVPVFTPPAEDFTGNGTESPIPETEQAAPEPAQTTAEIVEPPVATVSAVHVTLPKSTRGRKPKNTITLPKQPGKRGRKSFKEMAAEADLINIPDDETLFQKQYYTIGEVAAMFNVNYSLLRLWTNEFDGFLQPKKNRKGDRFFRPVDVKNLHLIYHLLREKKYTMEGAKDYIKNQKKKADQQFEITVSLQKLKAFLLELKTNL